MKISYKPTYKLDKTYYEHTIKNSGEEIKIISFFKVDEHLFSNPPDHEKVVNKLLKILRGTGIAKITITFLDKNLQK